MGFTVSDVLGEAWAIYTRNSGRLILIAAIVFGILSLIYFAVAQSTSLVVAAFSVGVSILGVLSLQGALTFLVDDLRARRRERSIGELFGAVGPRLWVLLGAEVLASIGIVGGMILFILPGLLLLTFWCCIIPAVLLERRAVLESFRRSQFLVSGNALKVFAVIVITVALGTIVGSVIQLALTPLPRFVDIYVAGVIANAITMPYVAVAWTVMFFELRRAKEGTA